MPTFAQVYNNFNKGKENGLIPQDESISSYASKMLGYTGDPSYQSIAQGGTVSNAIRSGSAMLTNAINSGPVDEWLGAATQRVGDLFGIDKEVSYNAGASLPRAIADFAPLAIGGALAPVTGGASLAPALAATSGLSAANAFEQTGKPIDALIGGVSPYVGGKLADMGSKAALGFAARSPVIQKLGFTGGTKVANAALNAADQATLAGRGLAQDVVNATTKSFTQLDRPLDKILGYVGGELAANAGFTALDVAQQGTDAVFNRNYLFANLISNVPFAAADLAGSFHSKQISPTEYNIPEAQPKYISPGEEQAVKAAATFADFANDPAKQAELRKQYGLDIADVSLKSQELRAAVNSKLLGTQTLEENFASEWNNYVNSDPLARDAGFKPIQKGGPFASQWVNLNEPLGLENLPTKAQEIVDKFKDGQAELNRNYGAAVRKLATGPSLQDSLPHALQELKLDEFLKTPIEERDYAKALENSFLSLDGVDLVRDIHRREAGLEPLRPDLYQQFIDLYSGKPATFSPDKRIELIVAASLARGSVPKFAKAKKKAQEATDEGKPTEQVVEEALQEMQKENVQVIYPELEAQTKVFQQKLEDFQAQRATLEAQLQAAQVEGRAIDAESLQRQQDELGKQQEDAQLRQEAFKFLTKKKAVEQNSTVSSTVQLTTEQQSVLENHLATGSSLDRNLKLLEEPILNSKISFKKLSRVGSLPLNYVLQPEHKGLVINLPPTSFTKDRLTEGGVGIKSNDDTVVYIENPSRGYNTKSPEGEVLIAGPYRVKSVGKENFDMAVGGEKTKIILEELPIIKEQDLKSPIEKSAKPLNERSIDELVAAFEASALVPGNIMTIQAKLESELKLLSPRKKQELADALGVKPKELAAEFLSTRNKPVSERPVWEPTEADLYDESLKKIESKVEKLSDFAYAKNDRGQTFLIPKPEGTLMNAVSFAKKLLSNLVPSGEVEARSQELVSLAKMFNNPEVRYGDFGPQVDLNGTQLAASFRPAVTVNGVTYEAPTHLQAWERAFKKPYSEFGPKETAAMKDSVLKEGFVTEKGFLNRKDALNYFKEKGGVMNLVPGEQRDWLDSSDFLYAQNPAKVYGAASYKQKQIFINSKAFQGLSPAERLGFVFAHEQAHISFQKAIDGSYGPEAKAAAERAQEWVRTATPEAKKVVEDTIRELHLGKELAQQDGVRDVLGNLDNSEWLANNLAMYAAGVMKTSKPKQTFAMLPKPIRDFAEWMVQGFQGLVKGAKMWMQLSGGNLKAAKDVKLLLDSVRKSYRQAEWDTAQAEKFLDIEPTSMLDRAADLQYAQSRTGDPDFKEAPKAFIGNWFNKIVTPLSYLGRTHKELQEPVMAVFQSDTDRQNAINDVMKVMYGELTSGDKIKLNNPSFERVMGSEPLRKLYDAIQVYSQVKNMRMIKQSDSVNDRLAVEINRDALSPELRGKFDQFTPEAKKALVTVLAQAERANGLTQKKLLEADRNGFIPRLASVLVNRKSFNKEADFDKGLAIADGVLKDLEVNNPEAAAQKLSMLDEVDRAKTLETASLLSKQFLQLQAFYESHPTYMSFRRFKALKQRIVKDGKSDVIDASTEGELNALIKDYESKGWKTSGEVMRSKDTKSKEQYQINDELLNIVRNHDAEFSDLVNKLDLPDEVKTQLLSAATTVDVMTREINGRELYRPMGARKLKGDLSRFSWLEQFMHYTPAALSAAQKRALGAKVNYWMQAPGLENMRTQKDQFMALYEQSKQSDPAFWRNVNKMNATWHIGWNLPGHIAELFQPILTGVHELVAQGASLPGAMKAFQQAEKEMIKVQAFRIKDKLFKNGAAKFTHQGEEFEGMPAMWLRANGVKGDNLEIARMLHKASHRYQRAPMSEVQEFIGQDEMNLQRLSDGESKLTLAEALTKPFHTYANAAMGFYSQFPMHNGVVSLVAAYRHARKQGADVAKAQQQAELFDLTTNNSSGKLERPEMFGKLGGAGHLVYSLTSYVRGRFAQLATYYRHGFDAEQFKGKLTPAEIANAKKAFQTMILAQVGAAGLLGLPFVGAGIALMEEMTGEDLKGKLINAMNEVTGDPSLGRMFTHGMASTLAESMGVPADMHSRFALSSFLGTNAYDGMSAKSFMGPSVAMLESLYKLGGALAQGKTPQEALTVGGPGGVKRLAEALGEDFQQKNPDANLAMAALGFRSGQQVKQKEYEQILRKQELESRRAMDESAKRISEAMSLSPFEARKALLLEADSLVSKELDYQSQQEVRKQNVKDLVNKVAMLQAEKAAPADVRSSIPQRIAPLASQTAQSMGVQMNDPMQLARALAQQQARSTLGQTLSRRPVKNAMLEDLQWGANPWNF